MIINNRETERFETFFEAVGWVMAKLDCSNQEACHIVWDKQFTMGSDRAIWITL